MIIVAGVAMTNAALSRAGEGHDLTFPQWRVLVVLGSGEALPVSEISRQIDVTLPATGRQLRRLEQRGLVRLEPDPVDRRVTRARLSEAGRATRASIVDERRAMIHRAVSRSTDRTGAAAEIARIAQALAGDRSVDASVAREARRSGPTSGRRAGT